MAGEIILYQTEDGQTRISLTARDGSAWLTQLQMAELFETTVSNINKHVKAIIADKEQPEATIEYYSIVQDEGARSITRKVAHYNLRMIMAVGFRVRSPRGLQFRRWASASLSEFLVKGFIMDDARLKEPETGYFEELLARIRDIRSSEKIFYRKVLEIYATSVDYDPSAEASQLFFQTVQNKMHWAAHGHTAAEIISARADAGKDHMGLMNWTGQPKGAAPRKRDAIVAKNYLDEEELNTLNRIVNAYLEFAELQALSRTPMTMGKWVSKLDDFLRLGDREVLTHAGRMSAEKAKLKGEAEFERWRARVEEEPSAVEQHFAEAVSKAKVLEKAVKRSGKGGGE